MTPDTHDTDPAFVHAVVLTLEKVRHLGISLIRLYHRLDLDTGGQSFDEPVLFVANHGFGAGFDPHVFAAFAALEELGVDRDLTILIHQSTFDMGLGPFVEPFGAKPASRAGAQEAFDAGRHVMVMPGGDQEAWRPFTDRNRIVFSGRRGFARLALDAGVPIVPIVSAGGPETVFALPDPGFAKVFGLDRLLRLKRLPVSVSLPWGLTVGLVGTLVPYLPLPAKLSTRVLPPMRAGAGESAKEFGDRVEAAMQECLDGLTANRRYLLG